MRHHPGGHLARERPTDGIALVGARSEHEHAPSVAERTERERDPIRRRLRGAVHRCDEAGRPQRSIPREERCGVPVRADAEEHEVERRGGDGRLVQRRALLGAELPRNTVHGRGRNAREEGFGRHRGREGLGGGERAGLVHARIPRDRSTVVVTPLVRVAEPPSHSR